MILHHHDPVMSYKAGLCSSAGNNEAPSVKIPPINKDKRLGQTAVVKIQQPFALSSMSQENNKTQSLPPIKNSKLPSVYSSKSPFIDSSVNDMNLPPLRKSFIPLETRKRLKKSFHFMRPLLPLPPPPPPPPPPSLCSALSTWHFYPSFNHEYYHNHLGIQPIINKPQNLSILTTVDFNHLKETKLYPKHLSKSKENDVSLEPLTNASHHKKKNKRHIKASQLSKLKLTKLPPLSSVPLSTIFIDGSALNITPKVPNKESYRTRSEIVLPTLSRAKNKEHHSSILRKQISISLIDLNTYLQFGDTYTQKQENVNQVHEYIPQAKKYYRKSFTNENKPFMLPTLHVQNLDFPEKRYASYLQACKPLSRLKKAPLKLKPTENLDNWSVNIMEKLLPISQPTSTHRNQTIVSVKKARPKENHSFASPNPFPDLIISGSQFESLARLSSEMSDMLKTTLHQVGEMIEQTENCIDRLQQFHKEQQPSWLPPNLPVLMEENEEHTTQGENEDKLAQHNEMETIKLSDTLVRNQKLTSAQIDVQNVRKLNDIKLSQVRSGNTEEKDESNQRIETQLAPLNSQAPLKHTDTRTQKEIVEQRLKKRGVKLYSDEEALMILKQAKNDLKHLDRKENAMVENALPEIDVDKRKLKRKGQKRKKTKDTDSEMTIENHNSNEELLLIEKEKDQDGLNENNTTFENDFKHTDLTEVLKFSSQDLLATNENELPVSQEETIPHEQDNISEKKKTELPVTQEEIVPKEWDRVNLVSASSLELNNSKLSLSLHDFSDFDKMEASITSNISSVSTAMTAHVTNIGLPSNIDQSLPSSRRHSSGSSWKSSSVKQYSSFSSRKNSSETNQERSVKVDNKISSPLVQNTTIGTSQDDRIEFEISHPNTVSKPSTRQSSRDSRSTSGSRPFNFADRIQEKAAKQAAQRTELVLKKRQEEKERKAAKLLEEERKRKERESRNKDIEVSILQDLEQQQRDIILRRKLEKEARRKTEEEIKERERLEFERQLQEYARKELEKQQMIQKLEKLKHEAEMKQIWHWYEEAVVNQYCQNIEIWDEIDYAYLEYFNSAEYRDFIKQIDKEKKLQEAILFEQSLIEAFELKRQELLLKLEQAHQQFLESLEQHKSELSLHLQISFLFSYFDCVPDLMLQSLIEARN